MDVDVSSLKLWARSFGWRKRIWEKDAEVARQIADKSLSANVAEADRNLKVVRAAIMRLARGIVEGHVKMQMSDLERLVRLENELVRGPNSPTGEHDDALRARVVIYIPDNGRDGYPATDVSLLPPDDKAVMTPDAPTPQD
jgi:hypothetical protein